jgi:hypothetical protein
MQAGFQLFESTFHGPSPGVKIENLAGAVRVEIGHDQFDLFRPVVSPLFTAVFI